jgi:hypothetical protein
MEELKRLDKKKLLLSPSVSKQQTRVGYGSIYNNDNDDMSDHNTTTQKSSNNRREHTSIAKSQESILSSQIKN